MKHTIEQLSQRLDDTENIYARLLALEKDKQQAIMERDPGGVMEMLDDERELIAQAADLEAEVLRLRDEVGSMLNDLPASGGEPVTLREIAATLDTPQSARIEDKRHRIMQLAMNLRHTSQTNFLLLKQCSDLLDELINTTAGRERDCATYGAIGGSRAPKGTAGAMMDVVAGD